MAEWNATGEQPAAAVAGAAAEDIVGIQGSVASLQQEMAELRTMLSQLMRGTTSTSRVRAVDGGEESRGGTHAAAGAGAGRARAPTGGVWGSAFSQTMEQIQDANSVGAVSSKVSLAGDPNGIHAFQFLNGINSIRVDEKFDCQQRRDEDRWWGGCI